MSNIVFFISKTKFKENNFNLKKQYFLLKKQAKLFKLIGFFRIIFATKTFDNYNFVLIHYFNTKKIQISLFQVKKIVHLLAYDESI